MSDALMYLREREERRRALTAEVVDAARGLAHVPYGEGELVRARLRQALEALDVFEGERIPLGIRTRRSD